MSYKYTDLRKVDLRNMNLDTLKKLAYEEIKHYQEIKDVTLQSQRLQEAFNLIRLEKNLQRYRMFNEEVQELCNTIKKLTKSDSELKQEEREKTDYSIKYRNQLHK